MNRDLTGRWDGIFNYPRALPPNGFVARLVEQDGALTGEVEEVRDDPGALVETLVAMLDGERIGSAVRFTKRYDALDRAGHPVRYDGTLAPDGDEITGEWTIPGIWSGSFIMVRQAGVEEPAARDAEADATVGPAPISLSYKLSMRHAADAL